MYGDTVDNIHLKYVGFVSRCVKSGVPPGAINILGALFWAIFRQPLGNIFF